MDNKRILFGSLLLIAVNAGYSQSFVEQYQNFKNDIELQYSSFREDCNQKYAEFLLTAWEWYEGNAPIPLPMDVNPVPPKPYNGEEQDAPIAVEPIAIRPIDDTPQPLPVEPIKEQTLPDEKYMSFDFYGNTCKVRIPESAKIKVADCSPNSIASAWQQLSSDVMNNTIRDCLETRIRYNLCDWAYLNYIDTLSRQFRTESNSATLLMAFLYCQSGYEMRLGVDNGKLIMLYASNHQIYEKTYYVMDGKNYYPYGQEPSRSLQICNAQFEGETPLSLAINSDLLLGDTLSEPRTIESRGYKPIAATAQTPVELIKFFDNYPSSAIDNNPLTRWAMYANTPLSSKTKEILYPSLKKAIIDSEEKEAVGKLLNWVQTGFEYEYDDKVWGHDRAFFAEETLFYPYCDCEDRSILFSRLVRDLLNLDVALIYYPGHLATAVCFNQDVGGDAMMIGGRKFIVCDPTYIGAPVGRQMPGLEYDKAQSIIVRK